MPPKKANNPYLLLVEGADDSAVIRHLLMRNGYDWDQAGVLRPYVQAFDGVEKLLAALPQELKSSGLARLGVVVDVDTQVASRWHALRDRVEKQSVTLPLQPDADGTIVAGRLPGTQLGIWLMPDNRTTGTLEHFVETLVPADDPCWGDAQHSARQAQARYGEKGCADVDLPKSGLHTWLAWQREPGRPFGTALAAHFLGHDSPQAAAFIGWFLRLFPPQLPDRAPL